MDGIEIRVMIHSMLNRVFGVYLQRLSAIFLMAMSKLISAKASLEEKIRKIRMRALRNIALGLTIIPASSTGNGISGSSIFNSIWSLLMSGFGSIMKTLETAFGSVMGGFTSGVNTMWSSWGFSLAQYGIWAPLAMIISLAVAGFVAYLFFDLYGAEKDVLGGLRDL